MEEEGGGGERGASRSWRAERKGSLADPEGERKIVRIVRK